MSLKLLVYDLQTNKNDHFDLTMTSIYHYHRTCDSSTECNVVKPAFRLEREWSRVETDMSQTASFIIIFWHVFCYEHRLKKLYLLPNLET